VSPADIHYFGLSLQGVVDLDTNKYSDIVVGAPKSDTLVMLRTRPVVSFTTTVRFEPPNVDVFSCFSKSNEKTDCIQLVACISGDGVGVEDSIDFHYDLDLDTTLKRVIFAESSQRLASASSIKKNVTMPKGKEFCRTFPLQVRRNIKDYSTAILASTKISMTPEHLAVPMSSLIDPDANTPATVEGRFLQNCGDDMICSFDLSVEADITLPTVLIKNKYGNKDAEKDLSKNGQVYVVASKEGYIAVQVNLTNNGEHAFETELDITYSKEFVMQPLKFDGAACFEEIIDDEPPAESTDGYAIRRFAYVQTLGNIFEENSKCNFQFNFTDGHIKSSGKLSQFHMNITAFTSTTDGADTKPSDNTYLINKDVIYRSDVYVKKVSQSSRPVFNFTANETKIYSIADIGPSRIFAKYEIKGTGYSVIPLSTVNFTFPSKIGDDDQQRILYLYRASCSTDQGEECVCDNSAVDVYSFRNTTLHSNNHNESTNVNLVPNPDELNSTMFDCSGHDSLSNVTCETFSCDIVNLKKDQTYTFLVEFRMWTSTFNMPFNGSDTIQFKSGFKYSTEKSPLIYDESGNNDILKTSEVDITAEEWKRVDMPQKKDQTWIIILAILLGLLVLLIIATVLWKVGFFKSQYKDLQNQQQQANEGGEKPPDGGDGPDAEDPLTG